MTASFVPFPYLNCCKFCHFHQIYIAVSSQRFQVSWRVVLYTEGCVGRDSVNHNRRIYFMTEFQKCLLLFIVLTCEQRYGNIAFYQLIFLILHSFKENQLFNTLVFYFKFQFFKAQKAKWN